MSYLDYAVAVGSEAKKLLPSYVDIKIKHRETCREAGQVREVYDWSLKECLTHKEHYKAECCWIKTKPILDKWQDKKKPEYALRVELPIPCLYKTSFYHHHFRGEEYVGDFADTTDSLRFGDLAGGVVSDWRVNSLIQGEEYGEEYGFRGWGGEDLMKALLRVSCTIAGVRWWSVYGIDKPKRL